MLAVRLAGHGGLYVVERVKRGIYSLSRLARWVHEGDVVAVKGWQAPREVEMDIEVDDPSCHVPDALNWWQAAQIEEPPSDLGLGGEFAELQVAVVFGPPETDASQDEPSFVDVLEHRSQPLAPAKGINTLVEGSFGLPDSQVAGGAEVIDVDGIDRIRAEVKQSPEELLSGMRDQYLQALYISKVRTLSLRFRGLVPDAMLPDILGLLCQRPIDTLPHRFPNIWPGAIPITH